MTYLFLKTRPNRKHCLPNISSSARQTCLPVWPPRQTLLDKHILLVNVFETFQKHFLLVTSKKCLSSTCLCSCQTNKHCAWQTKLQMFVKQCLAVWPELKSLVLNTFRTNYAFFAFEICYLPRITQFALKLRTNSPSLSQSESSNFSQCVIT